MRSTRLSSRYAKSLLNLAVEQNKLDDTLKDMRCVVDMCSNNKDLVLMLKSPIIKTDKKISILFEIFSPNVSELTMAFINIITNKKREMHMQAIADSFINLYKSYKNIKTVSITTALPISDQTKSEIMTYIKKTGSDEVELTEIVDADIIGGVIIKMGDKQLDASVTRNIKKLQKTFNKNLYIKDF